MKPPPQVVYLAAVNYCSDSEKVLSKEVVILGLKRRQFVLIVWKMLNLKCKKENCMGFKIAFKLLKECTGRVLGKIKLDQTKLSVQIC